MTTTPPNANDSKIGSIKWILSVLFFTFISFNGNAKTVYLLDFDGTVVSDGESTSSWKTPWVLVRINKLHSASQLSYIDSRNLPDTIEISYGEYLELAPLIGKDEGQVGSLIPVQMDSDAFLKRPKTILPGLYRISPESTFRFYKTGPNGENYLTKHLDEALFRAESRNYSKKSWQGRAFPLLQAALSHPQSVGNVYHTTAREQSQEELNEFYSRLYELGLVKFAEGLDSRGRVSTPKIISLESPQSILFGRSLSNRKANLPLEMARQLLVTPDSKHKELSVREKDAIAGITKEMHTLIVGEDHPQYVRLIGQQMKELSADSHFRSDIKFVLFNAGSDSDVSGSEWPYRWIVFENGFARQAIAQEISSWLKSDGSCSGLLGGNKSSGVVQ